MPKVFAAPPFEVNSMENNKSIPAPRREHNSALIFGIFQIFTTAVIILSQWITIKVNFSALSVVNSSVAYITVFFCGWFLVFYDSVLVKRSPDNYKKYSFVLVCCERLWYIGSIVCFNLCIVVAVTNGRCDHSTFLAYFGCNSSDAHQMPEGVMVMSLFLPMSLNLLRSSLPWECLCLGWAISVAVNAFCIAQFDLTVSLGCFCLTLPLSAMITYENYRQQMVMRRLLSTRSEGSLEGGSTASALHPSSPTGSAFSTFSEVSEIKHMMGNVAHDLKTVSILLNDSPFISAP